MGSQSCPAPDATDELASVDVGHDHIAHHQVGHLALHLGQTCAPVFGDAHVEAAPSQERGQRPGDRLVVVDEQDPGALGLFGDHQPRPREFALPSSSSVGVGPVQYTSLALPDTVAVPIVPA